MMRTVVFKITGDTEAGKVIKDGIQRGTALATEELNKMREELRILKAKEAVRDARDAAYFTDLILDAREDYALPEPPKGLAERLLQGYALICLGIDTAFRKLQAINREP